VTLLVSPGGATGGDQPAVVPGETARTSYLGPGWPLAVLYLGFPLWWALGLAQLIFFAMAAAMAIILRRTRPLLVPHGFALWLLFLVWMTAGVFLLRAQAPGTLPGGGLSRFLNFAVWAGWYVAVTIVMIYVVNTARQLPTKRIVDLLGAMFVITTVFGVLAILAPEFEFRSLMELVLPRSLTSSNFVTTLVHPSLATNSDFLGYSQPRPTAPFPYSNAWGNNLALYLPFFILGWFGRDAGWRRKVGPIVLLAATLPITFSLNRGLWLAIALAAAYAAVRLAVNGRSRAFQVLTAAVLVGAFAFVSSPLYATVQLRLETPHSNERRTSVATEVFGVTAAGSPLLGYGTTRTMQGSFASLAGGATADCRQCAAPPLGTQGFVWRLVLTTGFVGTVLCLAFLGLQFLRRARGPSALDVTTCATLLMAGCLFFVYDSLGSALFTVMITVGLMARQHEDVVVPVSVP
jgi:hypothetical protein